MTFPSAPSAPRHTREFFNNSPMRTLVQRLQRELDRACELYVPAAEAAEYDAQQCRYFLRRNSRGDLQYTRQRLDAGGGDSTEELLLDTGLVNHGLEPISLSVSPCGSLLGYMVDPKKNEECHLYIHSLSKPDLASRMDPVLVVRDVCNFALAWDGTTVLYTAPDKQRRPASIIRRNVFADEEGETIAQDPDPRNFLDVTATKDKRYILLNRNSKRRSGVSMLNARQPRTAPKPILEDADFTYFVEHIRGTLYIMANKDGAFKLYRTPPNATDFNAWEVVYAPSDRFIFDAEAFENHFFFYELDQQAVPGGTILDLQDGRLTTVCLPKEYQLSRLDQGINLDFTSTHCRFSTSSVLDPHTSWVVDMEARRLVQSGLSVDVADKCNFQTADYCIRREWAPSHDGTLVPMTLIHPKEVKAPMPALIIAYGAYGESVDIGFNAAWIPLVRRNWLISILHVRGGGELGPDWYRAGRQSQLKNSFFDFEACIDFLVKDGLADKDKLCAYGTSAGALLAGHHCNAGKLPLCAAVLRVPFLDLVGAMADEDLPLTAHETDEWGDPFSDPDAKDRIHELCPYTNLSSARVHPWMLLSSTMEDFRVPYWGPAKYAAKMRHARDNTMTPTLLDVQESGGHFSRSATADAEMLAFLLHATQQ